MVLTLPSHGSAADAPQGYWDYAAIAADLLAIADASGATRAVGVSLGTGALTRVVAEHPDRFERLALLLPAALDRPREVSVAWALERLAESVAAASADDGAALRELVAAEFPPDAPPTEHIEQRTAALRRLEPALHALAEQRVLDDASPLAVARSEVLVVGATEDPLHPAGVARRTAEAFPGARLELLPSAAPLVTHRRAVRELLTGFLPG